MNRTEFELAFRTLPFLDAHADLPAGILPVRPGRLLVWEPEALDRIFRDDKRLRHPGSRSLNPLLGPKSLLWADGDRHAAYRRVLGTPLRGRHLAHYHDMITEVTGDAVEKLVPGKTFVLADWTRQVALNIVSRIVLGGADETALTAFTQWIDRALGSRRRTLAYRLLRGKLPGSGEHLDSALVRVAKSTSDAHSLVALMLAPGNPIGRIDDGELRDQIVSLLFAGHETTASATAWTLYQLTRRPRLRQDVLSELDTGGNASDPGRVPLLQAVIQEVLRLSPPVEVAGNRLLTEETELLGHRCPAGTVVTPAIYLAHHRSGLFPRPHRFDPGRFLDRKGTPDGYLPFGGGTRYCLGSQLGQLEIRMITAALVRRRTLRVVNPRAGKPALRGHAMAPSNRLRVEVLN
ncbi:cytochrome P450 [Amycolatopsis pithecellobii]|uniref:Cytochrome P450 n=1 Tax=Amycolatopsis pithecellobii TaxID=664692 RepID=A0A6N7YVH3_9PSEU|nr:cytochrome P450 [Amycolatopsis pithecellobii]MTD57077.1 cytochrome P450 [Amycolatopsis pithecellobii]